MDRERRRVLMLLSNPFAPDPRVHKEARTLTRNGYTVTILAWDRQGNGQYPARQEVDGIHVERITVRSGYGLGLRQILPMMVFWCKAFKKARKMDIQVVHSHDLDTLPLGVALARTKGVPLVYDSHERFPETLRFRVPGVVVRIAYLLEGLLARFVNVIITASAVTADELQAISHKCTVHVSNTANVAEFDNIDPDEIRKERERLGIHRDDLVVAYIGRFDPQRMIDRLVYAVEGREGITALIVGQMAGTPIPDLANSRPNVICLGWVAPHRVPLYTSVADVIYYGFDPSHPYARYAAPNALYNCIAAGRAIIATGGGELGTIIRETECGLILASPEPAAIAGAIDRLATDRCYLARLQQNARDAARHTYNWENAAQKLVSVYASLSRLQPEQEMVERA